jgi:hypothetical protein
MIYREGWQVVNRIKLVAERRGVKRSASAGHEQKNIFVSSFVTLDFLLKKNKK